MPGQQLQTTALVLGRLPSGADAFETLTVFSEEQGQLTCLKRLKTGRSTPARRGAAPPGESCLDLFDEAELWLESTNQGRTWFIREHRHLVRHPGIGRSYEALRTAAALATLVTRNPVPDDSRGPVAALLRQSFVSLEQADRPDLVWFKALYRFLRDEGYPAKQHWWPQLPAADRVAAAQILKQPIAGQTSAPNVVARLIRRLEAWVGTDTEIRLAEGSPAVRDGKH
ncbi:MAG: hypothetical protein ACHQ5A_11825 [Opitutales bacterium]